MRDRFARGLSVAIEGTIALLAAGSAWPFASRPHVFEWILFVGIAVLLLLWGLRAVVEGRVLWKPCAAVLCLGALLVCAILQIVPLPESWVATISPKTASLRAAFLPSAEELGGAALPSRTTLSLDPGATQIELLRWLAIIALFAAVRNNPLSPAGCIRLGWVLAINGAVLSIEAIGQIASSSPTVVYWMFPTEDVNAHVFGPFTTRNHGADYLMLCMGLGIGLLLGTRRSAEEGGFSWRDVFRDPRVMWLSCALAATFAGLMATLSRGALASFLFAGFVGLIVYATRFGGWKFLVGGIGVVAVAAAAAVWFAPDRVVQRWQGTNVHDASAQYRVAMWLRTLPLVAEFPLTGTGLGTFQSMELFVRPSGIGHHMATRYAHSDYLQLWIEGGTIQFGLVMAVVVIFFVRGYRAFARHAESSLGRLALGCSIGFTALAVHSLGDFGLHTPAVAALAAVVCGTMLNIGDMAPNGGRPSAGRATRGRTSRRERPTSLPTSLPEPTSAGRLAGALQFVALAVVSAYLVHTGWRMQRAERLILASRYDPARMLDYAKAAAELAPEQARYDVSLAGAYLQKFARTSGAVEAGRIVLGAADDAAFPAALASLQLASMRAPGEHAVDPNLQAANALLLRACVKSPLDYDAQENLERISTTAFRQFRTQRLERLVKLSPCQPAPWFRMAGVALDEKDLDKAYASFRNALKMEKKFLPEVLKVTPERISRADLLKNVLFDDPDLIYSAAQLISEDVGEFPEERAYYQTALDLLAKKPQPLVVEDRQLKAWTHLALATDEEIDVQRKLAIDEMRAAVQVNPADADVRVELARALVEAEQEMEAMRELEIVLARTRNHRGAAAMLNRIRQGAAVGGVHGSRHDLLPKELDDDTARLVRAATVRLRRPGGESANAVVLKMRVPTPGKALLLTTAHGLEDVSDLEVLIYPGVKEPPSDKQATRVGNVRVVAATPKEAQDLALLEIQFRPDFVVNGLPLETFKVLPKQLPLAAFSAQCEKGSGTGAVTKKVTIEREARKTEEKAINVPAAFAPKFWQTKEAPQPGDSGGPLVDGRGRIIGICSGSVGSSGYYTHLRDIRAFLKDYAVEK